tara:strand:+ start:3316 stop:3600 length:285 start_codon:yes stop_codon:yes gene_type:complete
MELENHKQNTDKLDFLMNFPKFVLLQALLELTRKVYTDAFERRLGKKKLDLFKKYNHKIDYISEEEVLEETGYILGLYLEEFRKQTAKSEKGVH